MYREDHIRPLRPVTKSDLVFESRFGVVMHPASAETGVNGMKEPR
jgi:hypothetical protein